MVTGGAPGGTVVVHCHPLADSLTAAARDRVTAGLREAGRGVRVHDLYADGWDRRPDVGLHQADLAWCDELVLVYPTWWSGPPALLADWIVRCWTPGVRRRNIRRLAAVTTHGSPRRINLLEGEAGRRQLSRWLRPRCAPTARFEWHALYGVDTCSPERRQAFLDRVEDRFSRR